MNKIFNPKMLTLARDSRGLTQLELAKDIDMQQSILSKIEQGFRGVSEEEVKLFGSKLSYPESFFFQSHNLYPSNTDYRKKTAIPVKMINRVEAMMNIYRSNIHLLLKSVELPEKSFPVIDRDGIDPVHVARQLRTFWGVPKGPIENLTKLLESKGIIIILFDFGTDKIDGRSMITQDGHPIIFLNKAFSGDRLRLTLAHECAHIILHLSNSYIFNKSEKEKEEEAWLFAAEFMMPQNEFIPQIPTKVTLSTLADLKRYWKVSMQAALTWISKNEALSDNQVKYLWYQISAKGYRKSEPIEIPKEQPTLITEIIQAHMTELDYSESQLAEMLCLLPSDLEQYYLTDKPKLKIIR
jgi:Zn-dependent peptidase ImmA (M78 family)/transcriptional regulator with XRE-family HTH domain